jgi:hypothetical protein
LLFSNRNFHIKYLQFEARLIIKAFFLFNRNGFSGIDQ